MQPPVLPSTATLPSVHEPRAFAAIRNTTDETPLVGEVEPFVAATAATQPPPSSNSSSVVVGNVRRPPPIPPALLALPQPVVAAAMRARPRTTTSNAAGPRGPGVDAASAAAERQLRAAKRQWLEQSQLMRQRAALLSKEFLPQKALAEHGLAEVVAPVLAEAASRTRSRLEEAAALKAAREHAAEQSVRFGKLVAHIGTGSDFLGELREAMEGAEAGLATLRTRHATALEQLSLEEREATSELDALYRRVDAWADEDARAAAATGQNGASAVMGAHVPRTTPTTISGSRVRDRRPVAGVSPTACSLALAHDDAASVAGASDGLACPSLDTAADGVGGGCSNALHAEIAQLDDCLARLGGADCGWDAEDHAAYLRLRTQVLGTTLGAASPAAGSGAATAADPEASTPCCLATVASALIVSPQAAIASPSVKAPVTDAMRSARVARLVERAAREIPGQDAASITAHEQAVAHREAALERRRHLLQQWRAAREGEARAARAAAARQVAAAACPGMASRVVIAGRRSSDDERTARRSEAEEARQQELDRWRQRKLDEQRAKQDAETAEQAESMKRAAKAAERRARVKEALSARAMERAAEQAALRGLAERQRREAAAGSSQARQLALASLQQRDAAHAERRKIAAVERAAETRRREERIRELAQAARPPPAADISRQRDTSRLLRPTQAAAARKEQAEAAREDADAAKHSRFKSGSLTFAAAGSRAGVAWRQGLH